MIAIPACRRLPPSGWRVHISNGCSPPFYQANLPIEILVKVHPEQKHSLKDFDGKKAVVPVTNNRINQIRVLCSRTPRMFQYRCDRFRLIPLPQVVRTVGEASINITIAALLSTASPTAITSLLLLMTVNPNRFSLYVAPGGSSYAVCAVDGRQHAISAFEDVIADLDAEGETDSHSAKVLSMTSRSA